MCFNLVLTQIKEFLETGKLQELEDIRAGKVTGNSGGGGGAEAAAAAVPKSAAAAIAHKFM